MLAFLINLWQKFLSDELTFGVIEEKSDERDYLYSVVRDEETIGAVYVPKNERKVIKTVSVKDQRPYNTCCFASATAQKEVDEGVELSLRSLVAYARKTGYITGNGYSSLRNSQLALINFGVAEAKLLEEAPKTSWEKYSAHYEALSSKVLDSAKSHKAKSTLLLTTQSDWFHALDNDRVIQTGCVWYTTYNKLSPPYVLPIGTGVSVGGHAYICIGYDLGKKVFIMQNSFGDTWGDNGRFYVRFSDFKSLYQGRLTVDEPVIEKVASSYEGKDIKSASDPKIYRVKDGKKHWYPDEKTFFSWGGRFGSDKTWILVSDSVMKAIPEGNRMSPLTQ